MSGLGLLASVVGSGAKAGAASARQIADDGRAAEAKELDRQYQTEQNNIQHQRQLERDDIQYGRQQTQADLAHKRSLQVARIKGSQKPATNQWQLIKVKDSEGNEQVVGRFNKTTGDRDMFDSSGGNGGGGGVLDFATNLPGGRKVGDKAKSLNDLENEQRQRDTTVEGKYAVGAPVPDYTQPNRRTPMESVAFVIDALSKGETPDINDVEAALPNLPPLYRAKAQALIDQK